MATVVKVIPSKKPTGKAVIEFEADELVMLQELLDNRPSKKYLDAWDSVSLAVDNALDDLN